jgi:DNA helicase MCM9
VLSEAIQRVAERRLEESDDKYCMSRKRFIHPRLVRPPLCESVCKRNVSSIRSSDVGIIIQVRGTVIRTGQIKMLESERQYSCDKCGHVFRVLADMDQHNGSLAVPTRFPGTLPRLCAYNMRLCVRSSACAQAHTRIPLQHLLCGVV